MFDFLVIAWVAASTQPASAQRATATAPTPDLIEFLGEWGDDNGNVVDPSALARPSAVPERKAGGTASAPTVMEGPVHVPPSR